MLRFFRALSKSWVGPAIMGVLLIALGVLGSGSARSLFGGRIADAIVQAGSRVVTPGQFQKMFNRNEEAYQQRTGQPFPLEEAVKQGADKGMLQDLATQTAYFEMLTQSGIRPSDEVVAVELKRQAESGQAPGLAAIFDSVTGKFRQEGLNQLLQGNGITLAEFQRELSDDIAVGDFTSAVHESFETPRIYAAIQATLLLESRDVTYFVIPAASVAPPAPPTDAQLTALMQAHKDALMLPERRRMTVVRFSAKALAPSLIVDPKAVEQQFAARKDSYGKPETRSLVEIPLNDPREAATVQAALNKGQDPTAVAKSIGVDAVSYADQPLSAIVDHKAGVAAFGLQAGQVSGPVQGDFKTVIVKVLKVTPAQAPDLAAARTQIEADLRQRQAMDKVYDLSQKFEDLRQGGASVADAAAKLGLQAVSVGPVTADGKQLTGPPDPSITPKLLTAAFQLQQGADSDVTEDTEKGEYFAVHLDQVIAPSMPGLNETGVRQMLTQAYMQQTVIAALQKKATDAQAALKAGQTFEAVAASFGGKVTHQIGLQRASARQYAQTLGQDFLAATFGTKAGQVFVAGSDPLKGLVVARIDAIRPADPRQIAQVLDAVRQQSAQPYLEGLIDAARQAAVKMVKPRTDLALARNTIGVDDAMVARATKGAASPAPAK
ncbi:MAG TPA: peptidyl-prolyl cis-trans isomerase [Caulobacteraceae bacterium]|jgi:peptidyl-prolyl cis-trans isomerase D